MPAPLINQEPVLKQYDFVKLDNDLLVVDPMDSTVVAVIPATSRRIRRRKVVRRVARPTTRRRRATKPRPLRKPDRQTSSQNFSTPLVLCSAAISCSWKQGRAIMFNLRRALGRGSGGHGVWHKFLRVLERSRATTPRPRQHAFARNLQFRVKMPQGFAECSAIAGRPLRTIPRLSKCCTDAPKPRPAYDLGAGWSTLAERYGFALLLPRATAVDDPNGCFNWFQPEHSRRGQGEPLSIRQINLKISLRSPYRSTPCRRHRAVGGWAIASRHPPYLLSGGICRWRDR